MRVAEEKVIWDNDYRHLVMAGFVKLFVHCLKSDGARASSTPIIYTCSSLLDALE